MTVIVINRFQGQIPRERPHALPPEAASLAVNCDTRRGSLEALRGVSPISAVSSAVSSLYTEDGLRFFTWPTDVDACKSLVIGDTNQRVFYTDGSFYYGTNGNLMSASGGAPASSWRMGVQPPQSFSLQTVRNFGVWPDGVTIQSSFFYESGGVKTQEQVIGLAQIGSDVGRKYQFTPPERNQTATGAVTITALGYGFFGQETLFETPETVIIVSDTEIQTQSGGVVTAAFVIVNNVQITLAVPKPPNQYLSVANLWNDADTTGKTSAGATPVLLIVGKKGNETIFTLYSEGSSLVRADQPAKVVIRQLTDSLTYEADIEWGGNGLIGKSSARKTAAYVATCVNIYGEESKPSDPLIVTTDYLQQADFQVFLPAQNGYAANSKVRIYETITGSRDTAYHLSHEFPAASGSANLAGVANSLATVGQTLETLGWDVPPSGVAGLQALPYGSYAMFKGNELYFTEQFRPHTTPLRYTMTFPNNIKSIKQTAFGLIVVTTATGYVVTGASPDSMYRQELPVQASIINKRAITTYQNVAFYASEDGLVLVRGASSSLIEWQRLFTRELWREQWGASFPDLLLASHDGFIVGLTPSGNGFIARLDEQVGDFATHTINARGAFVLPQTDGLYLGTSSGIVQWGAGSLLAATWVSKEFTIGRPVSFGVVEICGEGVCFVDFVTDGSLSLPSYTVNATPQGASVRIRGGFKAQRWTVELAPQADAVITSVRLAETPQELASV